MMTFIDLFAGVGGFRRGLELAGHKCVGFCEFDKFAVASYTSMHLITDEQRKYLATLDLKKRQKEILKDEYRNGEWYSSDIRSVRADDVPRADCWCFGAPCQSFSIAGKRKGLEGQSGLIREVFRIIRETREEDRPEWLIYENVKGMLSSNRGFDFLAILLEMDELGYDCEWQIFNSKYHSVPQNRERVYTVGHLRSRGRKQVFPLRSSDAEDSVSINIIGHREGYRRNTQVFDPRGGVEALDTAVPMFGIDFNIGGQERAIANAVTTRNTMAGCTNIKQDGTAVCIPVLTPDRAEKRQNGRRFKDNGDEAFTLTAQDIHGVMISEATAKGYAFAEVGDSVNLTMPNSKTRRGRVGKQEANTLDCACNQAVVISVPVIWYEKYKCYIAIRKLTPKECFRLQGWTDDYFEKAQFVNSDSQLYKQAGNGVTVTVVEDIGKRLKEV
jgi:DNA (cytosine-5)-methyltransferase 1